LSGGQQQRVAIARALVTQPSLLLADEPTGNLDSATSHEVMQIFGDLCAKRGITIVLITHERDIAAYGTRTIDFKDGHVQQSNFHDYQVLRLNQMPAVDVHIVPSTEKSGGAGEPGTPLIAPAVANAIAALTGQRLRELPLRIDA